MLVFQIPAFGLALKKDLQFIGDLYNVAIGYSYFGGQ
jgi:hypothetical protein